MLWERWTAELEKILTLNVFRGNRGEIMETLWLTCKPATQFHTGFQKAQSFCVHSPSSWVTQINSSLCSRVRYANNKESVCVCVSLQPCSSSHDCFLRASLPPAAFCPMLMTRGHEKSWPLVAPSWCFNNTHATQHIHKEVKRSTESFSFFNPVMSWVECTDSAFF